MSIDGNDWGLWWFRCLDSIGGAETVAVFSATVDGVMAGGIRMGSHNESNFGFNNLRWLLVDYCIGLSMI